jgi:hypothetical protein
MIAMSVGSTRMLEGDRERRWIVVVTDGRFVTLGRESDPSEAEILAAEAALQAQGLSGWLAIMEGNPHIGRLPHIMEVRPLGNPGVPFAEACAACLATIEKNRAHLPARDPG